MTYIFDLCSTEICQCSGMTASCVSYPYFVHRVSEKKHPLILLAIR